MGDELEASLIDQYTLLRDNSEENGTEQMLLHAGDVSLDSHSLTHSHRRCVRQEWKNAVHLIVAITELRGRYPNDDDSELLFSVRFLFESSNHTFCLCR